LVTNNNMKTVSEAMKVNEVPKHVVVPGIGGKQKGELGNLDNQHYGRGKRAREDVLAIRSSMLVNSSLACLRSKLEYFESLYLNTSDADAIATVSAATSVLGVDVFICLAGLFLIISSESNTQNEDQMFVKGTYKEKEEEILNQDVNEVNVLKVIESDNNFNMLQYHRMLYQYPITIPSLNRLLQHAH
nr:chromatin structure-remodeling complex protein SYD isoform X1 [Tanacetum cinerariifolium]